MYLIFDIGGTSIKYAKMNQRGEILDRGQFKTEKQDMTLFCQNLYEKIESCQDLQGVGISYPGIVDSEKRQIMHAAALPCLDGYLINEVLSDCHVPISIENDAKCAALAELWQGSLKGCSSALVMVLGTGIGGAIIQNGKLYKGRHFKAGEFGSFLCVQDIQKQEAVSLGKELSATGLIYQIAKALHLPPDGPCIFEKIQQKDPIAYSIFMNYCLSLTKEIFNIDYILDLEKVSIGGGISVQPILIETLNQCFQQWREKYRDDPYDLEIVACTHHHDANLIGALYHHLNQEGKLCGES